MKKNILITIIFLITFASGCNGTQKHFSKEEIINDAIKIATQELKSYSVDFTIVSKMRMISGEHEQKWFINGDGIAQLTRSPFAMYQFMNIELDMGNKNEGTIEMFETNQGTYLKKGGGWNYYSKELGEQRIPETINVYLLSLLSLMKENLSDLEIEETENSYKFVMSRTNGNANKFIAQIMNELFTDRFLYFSYESKKVIDSLKINEFDYSVEIRKKDLFPKSVYIKADTERSDNKIRYKMNQEFNATYSSFNSIDQLIVPEYETTTNGKRVTK